MATSVHEPIAVTPASRSPRTVRQDLCFAVLALLALTVFVGSVVPQADRSNRDEPQSDPLDDDLRTTLGRVNEALEQNWQGHGIQPVEQADDLTIARRVSLALQGTIPSLEEIRRFEAMPVDRRLAWWIEGVLHDPRSSDYLAERLARAYVGTEQGPFLIYRRRRFVTWLAEQLHDNRPYDQIVRQLIASDGLWTNEPATNFVTATVRNERKGPDESALAARVSRAFLGIRLDCAECHDHPFESWTQDDFRGLAAFFGKTEQTLTGIREGKGVTQIEDRTSGDRIALEPAVPFQPELLTPQRNARRQLAAWVTHRENRAFAAATVNRIWALLFGRPLVEPVDNLSLSNPQPAVLEVLADDFVEHRYDLRRLVRLIASSDAFRLDSRSPLDAEGQPLPAREITSAHETAWGAFPITRLRPEQVAGALLQASSLATIDHESHILIRIARAIGQKEFIERYGDAGEDELEPHGGTILQRLLLMNGSLVKDRTKAGNIASAATRIAMLAPDDASAVETAYLAVLTRRPTGEEEEYFQTRLRDTRGSRRQQVLEDLTWDLINATEFSWNH